MQKSITKPLLCLSISLCLPLLFASLFLASVDYKSHFLSFIPQLTNAVPCRPGSPPLRVYMYDLPPRFNVGLMDHTFPNNTPVTAENVPLWGWNDGLRRQHSVEYWMMASLLDQGDAESRLDREAVRVADPASADVFFVPFFSSLSFNIHVRHMAELNTVDENLQLELINILQASDHWKRSGGRDHVIPLHHPNAFRHYRDEITASIFIVADFGRIMNISRLTKDVVAPYVHMVESYVSEDSEDPYKSRKTLLFFRGRTIRKDEGKIRAQLRKLLNGTKDVIYEEGHASEEAFKAIVIRAPCCLSSSSLLRRFLLNFNHLSLPFEKRTPDDESTKQMQSSKFCLHPAGDTPSSCRLFDAIVSHCIPVILSDRIELPFEYEIDYTEFSIFFSDKEALKPGYLINELRGVSQEKWMKMWRRLKSISHHFEFQYPPKKEDAVNMIWRQVKHKVPAVKLAVHRTRRLKIPDWWR